MSNFDSVISLSDETMGVIMDFFLDSQEERIKIVKQIRGREFEIECIKSKRNKLGALLMVGYVYPSFYIKQSEVFKDRLVNGFKKQGYSCDVQSLSRKYRKGISYGVVWLEPVGNTGYNQKIEEVENEKRREIKLWIIDCATCGKPFFVAATGREFAEHFDFSCMCFECFEGLGGNDVDNGKTYIGLDNINDLQPRGLYEVDRVSNQGEFVG